MFNKIAVIGAGSWGTTLACLLGERYGITLWVRELELVEIIKKTRINKWFLPWCKLPETVQVTNSLEEAVTDADLLVTAIPSKFLRDIAKKFASYVNKKAIVVDVAKGLEYKTFKRMSQVLEEELPSDVKIVALSGPNHAEEVSKRIPTATVIASKHQECLPQIKKIFTRDYFKVYEHDDIVGVEICGAVKNIVAIATGICDGLGFGDNARASIITLGLTEMNKIGRYFGAKRKTVYGLAGVGDLVATCTSKHSRNRYVGEMLGKGFSMDEIKKRMHGMVAEGVMTTRAVYEFSIKNHIFLPLTSQVYKIIYESKDINMAISDLIRLI